MQTRMICWIVFIIFYSPITSASYKVIQTLLLSPDDRGTIVLPPGKYELERGLSLFADNVILSGSGQHETILSFREQKSGGESLLIKGKNITVKNLVIVNAPGDGLKVRDSENVTIKNIKVGWNEGLKPTNGAYAIYPVSSRHVKIYRCETFGASEAGIYLGQTVYGEISDNMTYHNVVGIEVENSQQVMIKNNRVYENSIGLLISDVPGLRIMGKDTNIDGNTILDNNLENFSSNFSHLGRDQSGIGLLLIGVKELVVQNNQFNGHQDKAKYFQAREKI